MKTEVDGKETEIIKLSKGYFTIIDNEDLPRVSEYKWNVTFSKGKKPRVSCTTKSRKTLGLSRFIMNAPDDKVVDHINGNPLDNRKSNLRICSQRENMFNKGLSKNNRSGYKGVYWSTRDNKWLSQIQTNDKVYYLGLYNDKINAAKAYDKKAIEFFGEYAKTNLPRKFYKLK